MRHDIYFFNGQKCLLIFSCSPIRKIQQISSHTHSNKQSKMSIFEWFTSARDKEIDIDEPEQKVFGPDQMYEGFIDPSFQELSDINARLTFFLNDEQHRHKLGHQDGGKICGDENQVQTLRSVGKQMIKLIGKKILSGDFNLTKVSFPIKAMIPKTALENATLGCCTMPYFMKKACESQSPIEKMKYVLTAITSSAYYMNLFLKPLNPVIGETFQGSYPDGTQIYCEQISHHPPINYFLVVGPNNSYRYMGYYSFEANAGFNTGTLINKGRRWFQFADGTKIDVTFNKEEFVNVFIGTLRLQAIGSFTLKDQSNGLECQVKYGKVKKKPSDYFEGSILQNGKLVSKFYGTYCGFLNFDEIRYWDGRYVQAIKIKLQENPLQSDSRNRSDLQKLKQGKIQQAQQEKQKIEQRQRKDAKLRHQFKNK